jgi:hypothetical protein
MQWPEQDNADEPSAHPEIVLRLLRVSSTHLSLGKDAPLEWPFIGFARNLNTFRLSKELRHRQTRTNIVLSSRDSRAEEAKKSALLTRMPAQRI